MVETLYRTLLQFSMSAIICKGLQFAPFRLPGELCHGRIGIGCHALILFADPLHVTLTTDHNERKAALALAKENCRWNQSIGCESSR